MLFTKNNISAYTLSMIVVFLDCFSKSKVIEFFTNNQSIHYLKINSFISIFLVWNKGISFGLFNDFTYATQIFTVINITIIICLFLWLNKINNFSLKLAFAMVIGGGVGNIIDRIKYNAVADFIYLHYQNFAWPAFNIADSFITIGVFVILIHSYKFGGTKNV